MAKTFRKQIDDKKYSDGQTTARQVRAQIIDTIYCTCKNPYPMSDSATGEEVCDNCGKEI